jgi:ribonuclease R
MVNHDDLDTFTIDPKSSVDFDDAITVDVPNNIVYVHIVDIANTSHLTLNEWRRLRERCLTLYMANEHTEHLLDSNTASDTLSLVAGQSRQVITAKITLDGCKVLKYDIYRSTITVKRRWNYEMVALALQDNTAPEAIKYLAALTEDRNSVVKYNVNLPSLRLDVDTSTGKIANLHLENTNDPSHGLVATAMILANLVVSKHLASKAVPIPSRFHKKLAGMLPPNFAPSGIPTVDSFITIKKFARANYSLDEKGHFGLDLTDYVHFTSPMRRYADVLVHLLLSGWQPTTETIQEDIDTMNHRQNVVRQCQDLYEQWKVVRFLMDSLPTQRPVYITNVMPAGLIWFMPDLSLNGFAHVSTLAPSSQTRWVQEFGSDSMKRGTTEIRVGQGFMATVDSIDPTTSVVKLIIHTDKPV